MNEWREHSCVAHADLLAAYDLRAAKQEEYIHAYGLPLLVFTLNIPGEKKNFPLARRFFDNGLHLLCRYLKNAAATPVATEVVHRKTGSEAYFVIDAPPSTIKACGIELEGSFPAGRLFDIDIICADKSKLSRTELGYPPRKCLLCDGDAAVCRRATAHDIRELTAQAITLMRDHLHHSYAEYVASLALQAMLHEICTTPKPGLVDLANSGSHQDMNASTLIDSAFAIAPFFARITEQALYSTRDPSELLDELRPIGRDAENTMLAATGQVNTHKGLIFSFGVICAALGYCYARHQKPDVEAILALSGRIATSAYSDFRYFDAQQTHSNGEHVYHAHGLPGVRGEAAAGFPSVLRFALPALRKALQRGLSLPDAGLHALLQLMARIDDTNMIKRSSRATQLAWKNNMLAFLDGHPNHAEIFAFLHAANESFLQDNLSPGGAADLLAITYFLHFLDENAPGL